MTEMMDMFCIVKPGETLAEYAAYHSSPMALFDQAQAEKECRGLTFSAGCEYVVVRARIVVYDDRVTAMKTTP